MANDGSGIVAGVFAGPIDIHPKYGHLTIKVLVGAVRRSGEHANVGPGWGSGVEHAVERGGHKAIELLLRHGVAKGVSAKKHNGQKRHSKNEEVAL